MTNVNTILPTPVRRVDIIMRKDGLNPSRSKEVRRVIAAHESQLQEMSVMTRRSLFTGRHLKRIRAGSMVARKLHLDRRYIPHKDGLAEQNTTHNVKSKRMRLHVTQFMKRPDNSTFLPGKKDAVKDGVKKVQKYTLNDYIRNLHAKFCEENPDANMYLSFFRRATPKHVALVRFGRNSTCLCQKHQNVALKQRAIKQLGMPTSPNVLCTQVSNEEFEERLSTLVASTVKFEEWRRIEITLSEGKSTTRIRQVHDEVPTEQFCKLFKEEMALFREHVRRVTMQYQQICKLKENMPTTSATIQMDFAKNYVCSMNEEFQRAYFDRQQVTLQPMVVHWRIQTRTN